MKLPRCLLLSACLLVLRSVSAGADTSQAFVPNIQQGNWQLGGSFNFADRMPDSRDSYVNITVNLPVQYFVLDRFAAGVNLLYTRQGKAGTHDIGFGPALAYYFYAHDRIAAFLAQRADWDFFEDGTSFFSETTSLGLDFFIIPAVAVGPQINFEHQFGNTDYLSVNVLSFSGSFKFYF